MDDIFFIKKLIIERKKKDEKFSLKNEKGI
jgi:hypothetical protein